MGHEGSTTRSLGEILEKRCVCLKSYTFSLIIMKLCQNFVRMFVLMKSWTILKMGHVGS